MQIGIINIVIYICVMSNRGLNVNARNRSYSCGPSGSCACVDQRHMHCSSSLLELKTVCEYIGNITDHNVTSLVMGKSHIGSVRKADLKGCEELLELDLSANEIETLENDTFSVMLKLISLNLQRNNLSWLYANTEIQVGFPKSLKTLQLNRNANMSEAKTLLYPILQNLDHLEALYMDGLPYKSLPASYRSLLKLETMIFSGQLGHCKIPVVTNATFENLVSVRILNLAACNIRIIHAGGFQSLGNLEILDLSENRLLGFRPLRNISYSLQFTNIKLLNYSKVHDTFGLTTEIKLQDMCFLRNTSLSEVDFSKNRLARFEMNSMIIFPDSLKIFHAEENKFTFGLYLLQLGCVVNVEEYYGSFQNLPNKPEKYDDEPVTNDLEQYIADTDDCPYMALDYLRNVSKANKLCNFFEPGETVNIRRTIPAFPKTLRKIVFAQSNMVYTVPKIFIFPIQNNIEYIDLSRNVLKAMIGPIGPFPKLKYLDMSQCYCSDIGLGFFTLCKHTVETLQLQQNSLGKLLSDEKSGPSIFNNFSKLRTLNLSANTIPSLPAGIFSGVNNLHTLDLSVNNIEHWTINVDNLTHLLHLNLRNNFIQSLPTALLQRLQLNSERLNQSYTIDLRNNTINVNCNAKDFLQWMVKYNNNMVYFQTYTFVDMNGHGISAKEFMAAVLKLDKTCPSYSVIILICSVGLSVYLAVLIGGVIYKNRWNIRYILRNAKISHFRYRRLNDVEEIHYRYDAFISYANENFRFILDKLLPGLENIGLKLCLHDKDFLPGNDIADNIVEAISNSRKTVVVLSEAFMKSQWCLYEFNMARMESIYSRGESGCLIVVILEEVTSSSMSDEMLAWIRSNTYLEYTHNERGEQLFWEHFEEALMNKVTFSTL